MDDRVLRNFIHAIGSKLYEMQVGFAAIYNLCKRAGVFTESSFHAEMVDIEKSEDLRQMKAALDRFGASTGVAELEELLKSYKGPIQ